MIIGLLLLVGALIFEAGQLGRNFRFTATIKEKVLTGNDMLNLELHVHQLRA